MYTDESEELRALISSFCVAAANLNENRREPYWGALMHLHDIAALVLARPARHPLTYENGAAKECEQLRARNKELVEALDTRSLFSNPDILEKAANEIDCCPGCERVSYDFSVNSSECCASDRGDYCPNDLAETLRELATAIRALSKSNSIPEGGNGRS